MGGWVVNLNRKLVNYTTCVPFVLFASRPENGLVNTVVYVLVSVLA